MRRGLSLGIYGLSGLIGLLALAYPFVGRWGQVSAESNLQRADAPWLTAGLICLCLLALLIELQSQLVSAKVAAVLGLLAAAIAVLRFLEVAIPGLGGFSPVFAPIILAAYVFGARFGFLLGILALLTSALITGGVGPWLPYQMLATGWIGLTAGGLAWLVKRLRPAAPGGVHYKRADLWLLVGFGAVAGLAYGAVLNLYFWPFVVTEPAASYAPGEGLRSALEHYAAFYLVTSLVWDLFRAAGNAGLILFLGLPTLRALARFRDRVRFIPMTPAVGVAASHAPECRP